MLGWWTDESKEYRLEDLETPGKLISSCDIDFIEDSSPNDLAIIHNISPSPESIDKLVDNAISTDSISPSMSRTEFGGTEVKIIDRIPSILENRTTSERNILSDDRKKTPVTSQGRREESDLLNDLGFNLCVAPRSPVVRLVTYFGVREVAKTEVLRNQVEESEWTRRD